MNNSFFNENIIQTLNINIGKKVSIYQSFNNGKDSKEFDGIIEKCGDEYIVLSDPNSGNWYLFFIKYINYIKFEEEINFNQ